MDYSNEKYKNQGIHVLDCIFTVKNGVFKVLLINRKLEPFKGMWSLVGGALYRDETVEQGLRREVERKSGLKDIPMINFGIYSRPDRAPVFRMVALGYISVIDVDKVEILKETTSTNNAMWFDINKLPPLAFDHEEIIGDAIKYLRAHISDKGILNNLFPSCFTLADLHKAYECILGKEIDRRNFRKKLLADKIIRDTGKSRETKGVKSSKLYEFVE